MGCSGAESTDDDALDPAARVDEGTPSGGAGSGVNGDDQTDTPDGPSVDPNDPEPSPAVGEPAEPSPEPGVEPEAQGDDDVTPTPAGTDSTPAVQAPAADALYIPAARLTRAELDAILGDVLRDESRPAEQLLAEDEFSPYDNDFGRQTVSPALVDSLQFLAEDVAARALDDPEARAALVPCTPSAPDDAVCFDQVVARLAPLFFRAPVVEADAAGYRGLLEFAAEQGDFDVAVELLLTSFLQDPEFLYRLERGSASDVAGILDLNDHEIATRLAFTLWGSAPDEALLQTATAGQLRDPASRRDVAASMLDDARAQREMHRFHAMWLGYRSLPHDATLNAAFTAETEALVDRAVFEGQSYLTLFDSSETFIDEALALHYGFPSPEGGQGWVTYPADSGRAGILAHGSVLSSFSKFSDTSPTQRGIFVRTRLLCQEIPPPPAVVDVDQPPEEGSTECKLDRYKAHAEQSGCNDCHQLFDPIGFGLENYDMAGRYREADDANPDCLIDEPGSLPGMGEFRGPGELAQLLLDADVIEACFARQYLSHALANRSLTSDQAELAQQLGSELAANGARLDEWLLDFVAHERFGKRPEESR